MDSIINYLLLVIIFVFDPLAIALVIAANFVFGQLRKEKQALKESLEEEVIDIPEKDWVEDWPDGNDVDLETASLEDFDEEWGEAEPVNESLTQAAKQYNQTAPEPYQIYVSGSEPHPKNIDWEIVDEEKEHQKQKLEDQIKEVREQAEKLQANPNYSSWRKKKDLDLLSKQYDILADKRKTLDSNDDLIIKYT